MTQEILSDNEALVEKLAEFRYDATSSEPSELLERRYARAFAVKMGWVKLVAPPKPKSEGERIAEREIKLACDEEDGVVAFGYLIRWGRGIAKREALCETLRGCFARHIDAAIRERTEQCARIPEEAIAQSLGEFRPFVNGKAVAAAIRKLNAAPCGDGIEAGIGSPACSPRPPR